jgi:hypothetical protein
MGNADPGGTQVSGPDLEVQVHQVALTREQVREFGLPSTPLQKKERRAAAWHCLAEAAAEALNDEMEHQFEVLQEAVAADAPELPVFEIEPAISATAPEPLFSRRTISLMRLASWSLEKRLIDQDDGILPA